MIRRAVVLVAVLLSSALELQAAKAFFDHYEDGLKAARAEKWNEVVQHMSAAIAMEPKEQARARTYGAGFIAYHPYYYRGVAYFNLGELRKAEADLKQAKGVGAVQLGSLDSFQTKVETRLAQASQPAQQPAQQPNQPSQQPSLPSVPVATADPNLAPARQRAQQAIASANSAMQQAQTRNAPTLALNEWTNAQSILLDASQKQADAETAEDFNRAAQIAERAKSNFEVAGQAAQMAAANQRAVPGRAVEEMVKPIQDRVRSALGEYFAGNYTVAARSLESLTKTELARSHMAYAFLGASYYNRYVLSGKKNQTYLKQANNAFKKAKQLRTNLQLSNRYFSPRVRTYFQTVAR